MANLYVRSTDGNNADNGSTWALAKATLAGADAIDATGDVIYVSQAHTETTAGSLTFSFAGTAADPNRIVCGNDAAAPPTALSTAPTFASTAADNLIINGFIYWYGGTISAGTGTTLGSILCGNGGVYAQTYESVNFVLANSNAGSTIWTASGSGTRWINCNVKFGATTQGLRFTGNLFRWNGGAMVAGSSTPAALLKTWDSAANVLIENVDLSGFASTLVLTTPPPPGSRVVFRNCKLPGSWSGQILSTDFTLPGRVEMYNCDDGATNYELWIEDYAGTVRINTTVVRTGGASDGVTPLSLLMVTKSTTKYPNNVLASQEIVVYNSTTGSSKTVTIEFIHDNVTNLTNAEVWLEVNYLGTSGFPIGTLVTDAPADVLTAAADQTASSETWTTTGLANPNKQKLSVTFTPQMKGYFHCRVMLAKTTTTIYVDPKVTVS